MRLVWQLLAVIAVAVIGRMSSVAVQGTAWLTLIIGLATGVLSVVVYAWVVRRTEHRAPVEVAPTGAALSVAWSSLLGVGLFGFMAGAAVTEELVFRGILFRILEERTGTWIALTAIGLLFGLLHLVNPNATLSGPTLVTGGAFGPEGSVYAVAFGVLATGALMWLAYRRGHVIPLRRSARADMAAR